MLNRSVNFVMPAPGRYIEDCINNGAQAEPE
jgi:hypothetical protein